MKLQLSNIITIITVSLLFCSCGSSHKVIRGTEMSSTKATSSSADTSIHASGNDSRSRLVNTAGTWLGTPYIYGGHEKNKGTDCSGMIMEVYREALGIKIPRTTKDQHSFCRHIDKKKMQPGDILFFASQNSGGKTAHVGLYIGDNRMIHASSSKGVIISDLNEKYYLTHYIGAGTIDHPSLKSTKQSIQVATITINQSEAPQTNEESGAQAIASKTKEIDDTETPETSSSTRKRRGLRN